MRRQKLLTNRQPDPSPNPAVRKTPSGTPKFALDSPDSEEPTGGLVRSSNGYKGLMSALKLKSPGLNLKIGVPRIRKV